MHAQATRLAPALALAAGLLACGAPALALAAGLLACGDELATPPRQVSRVLGPLPQALLSVAGEDDGTLWLVGADADDGRGAYLARRSSGDAEAERIDLREVDVGGGDLWWVHVLGPGQVLVAGEGGRVLALRHGVITRFETGTRAPLYGVSARDDLALAVGGPPATLLAIDLARGTASALPLPADVSADARLFKVFAADRSFEVVGEGGVHLRVEPGPPPRVSSDPVPGRPRLVTIHGASTPGASRIAVGGLLEAYAVEIWDGGFRRVSPPSGALLNGVFVGPRTYAVGFLGTVFERVGETWETVRGVDPAFDAHAVFVDTTGTAWVAGGKLLDGSLGGGALWRVGAPPSPTLRSVDLDVVSPTDLEPDGSVTDPDTGPDGEVVEHCAELAPPATLELGERDSRGCFRAFTAGGEVRVVNGPQGGSHVELAVRFPAASDVDRIRIEATLVVDGSAVARFATRDLPAEGELGAATTRITTEVPVIFANADPSPWIGHTASLSCVVEAGTDTLTATIDLVLAR